MIELIEQLAGPVTGVSVLATLAWIAKVLNLKLFVAHLAEQLVMHATVRRMKRFGASDKQLVSFMSTHAITRAGRSP